MEEKNKITIIKELAQVFFMIGTFNVGGGYSMLPFLEKELIEKRHWVDEETLVDYFAIGQSTPGIIAINTATMVGYAQGGGFGKYCRHRIDDCHPGDCHHDNCLVFQSICG